MRVRAAQNPQRACLSAMSQRAPGEPFLTLFQIMRKVIEAVRTEFFGRTVLGARSEYAHAGGLQAVLDEYTHVLRESLSVAALAPAKIAEKLGAELIAALTIRAASLRIDDVTAPRYAREINVKPEPMRIRFAMRFGDGPLGRRATARLGWRVPRDTQELVRSAFNSPFWPFVTWFQPRWGRRVSIFIITATPLPTGTCRFPQSLFFSYLLLSPRSRALLVERHGSSMGNVVGTNYSR